MRYDLRLHGRTADGKVCEADISVYAASKRELQAEAEKAAANAPWRGLAASDDWIPEGAKITVEHVEMLEPKKRKK